MLESAVRHNGMESMFSAVISVDRVRTFKPSPRVYALGTEVLGLPVGEILFVSSNWWDAWGAKAFGYAFAGAIDLTPKESSRMALQTSPWLGLTKLLTLLRNNRRSRSWSGAGSTSDPALKIILSSRNSNYPYYELI